MIQAGHLPLIGDIRNAYKILDGKMKGRGNLGDLRG
jgi:hypothetical protein